MFLFFSFFFLQKFREIIECKILNSRQIDEIFADISNPAR